MTTRDLSKAGMVDLHCDTLTRDRFRAFPGGTLDDPSCQLALSRMPEGVPWVQCFAVFIPDSLRGAEAVAYFERHAADFDTQMARHRGRAAPCRRYGDIEAALAAGKCAALLTVEGGCVLAGDLRRVEKLRDAGVRMLTLTWNGPNELGSGHDTPGGLTAFGREAVAELERLGVLVDVSHLNDRGFEDLLSVAEKPFVASHSNARAVCGHRRNLPDEFIKEIVRRGGLIGLNYSRAFLSSSGGGGLDDLLRHVYHFLELGAERCLALGSDYDGTDIHPELGSVEKALAIPAYLAAHGVPPETAEAIASGNALRFFQKWLS